MTPDTLKTDKKIPTKCPTNVANSGFYALDLSHKGRQPEEHGGKTMNAKESVVRMKDRLASAGFVVEVVNQSTTKVTYRVTTKTDGNVWATVETFYLGATKLDVTNRWNKFFSYSRHGMSDYAFKTDITYSEMNSLINMAIFCVDAVKAGK